jgi:hypothetical protein
MIHRLRSVLLAGFLLSANTFAAILFEDDFNRLNSQFNDNGNWSAQGSAFIDETPPAGSDGNVLAFSSLVGGGDLLSIFFPVTPGTLYLSFDYFSSGVQGGTGGFIGYEPGDIWLTGDPENAVPYLNGDNTPLNNILVGQWHHIDMSFAYGGVTLSLQLEQFTAGSGPGTAYFDNIVVSDTPLTSSVPEPSSLALLGLGIAGVAASRLRRRKA